MNCPNCGNLETKKTADAARFERLELRDVTAKGAKSKNVTVKDKAGKILAEGLIGKRNEDLFGTGKGGVYMRIAGKKESWLIEGHCQYRERARRLGIEKRLSILNGGRHEAPSDYLTQGRSCGG